MKRILCYIALMLCCLPQVAAQINTEQVLRVGQNALYFEDYMLSIQYFNRVIQAKPYMARPYFMRSIAKINLEDYVGAEQDASRAIELNPYLTDAYEVRGVARQNLGRDREAIADYDRALELIPNNRQLMFNKALAQSQIKETAAADSTFTEIIRCYPGFDGAYLGRARLRLQQADTTAAIADIDRALELNKNSLNAYVMRADIAINRQNDFKTALADMDEAVKLQPHMAGLYINRAYLRYRLDDYFGAMDDFDYAIKLDPLNAPALFNRGLLQMEAMAYDKALADFDRVLELEPDDYRAIYNRAILNRHKGRLPQALADINRIIEQYPDLPTAYDIRSDIYAAMKDMNRAEADSRHARRLARTITDRPLTDEEIAAQTEQPADMPADKAAREFATLLTVDDNVDIKEEYHNQAIRGKVQDRNLQVDPEGWMELSYYATPSELRPNGYYIKEVDDINQTRILRCVILVTPDVPPIDERTGAGHFESIEYYNSYLAGHTPRAIDYIGRAMDFMSVRDYDRAVADIDRALALTPDLAVGHLMRAQAEYHRWQAERMGPVDTEQDARTREMLRRKQADDILQSLTRVIEISPGMAEAWYNKALMHITLDDYSAAIAALNKAIECKPDMGEAWYNRGYVYLKLGNKRLGIADLSRAGELGILPAYTLIKRLTR